MDEIMKRPLTRFKFGSTFVTTGFLYSDNYQTVPAPGVGDVWFKNLPGGLWTGDIHISTMIGLESNVTIHIGHITEVATRPNFDEDECEWEVLFKREDSAFSYEYEKQLEKLIEGLTIS